MPNYNHVTLIGRLGKDPEIKTFDNGGKIANFSLATSEKWNDRNGEKQERTQWHNIAVKKDGAVGVIEKYVKKGDAVMVIGKLEYRSYDKDGETKYITEVVVAPFGGEIVLLGGGKKDEGIAAAARENERRAEQEASQPDAIAEALEDELADWLA